MAQLVNPEWFFGMWPFFSHGTFLLGRAFFQLTQTDKMHELLKNQHDMILSR